MEKIDGKFARIALLVDNDLFEGLLIENYYSSQSKKRKKKILVQNCKLISILSKLVTEFTLEKNYT